MKKKEREKERRRRQGRRRKKESFAHTYAADCTGRENLVPMVARRSYGDTSVKLNLEERSSLRVFSPRRGAGFDYSREQTPFEIIFHGATLANVRVLSQVLISGLTSR